MYDKFMNKLFSTKRLMNCETIEVTHSCGSIMPNTMVVKKEDPGAFTIPCIIGVCKFCKALCDFGENIYLIPYVVFHKLVLGHPTPTTIRLLIDDCSINKPMGILYDVLVKVDLFILPIYFVIIYCEIDHEIPIILGRPLLATEKALVDMKYREMIF